MSLDILNRVEIQALSLSKQLDELIGSINSAVHRMSGLTLDCTTAFATTVDHTCETVNSSIKSTYALMAKCEELSNSMNRIEPLQKEIETLKRTLDKFEESLQTPS